MAFASFDSKNSNTPMGEINMVPLIDVMLVLLVIFIVTAPLLTNSVKLALPRATTNPTENKPTTPSTRNPTFTCAPTRTRPIATWHRPSLMPPRPASRKWASSPSPKTRTSNPLHFLPVQH